MAVVVIVLVVAAGGSRVEMTSRGYSRDVGLIRPSTHRKRAEIVNPFRPERIKSGYYF